LAAAQPTAILGEYGISWILTALEPRPFLSGPRSGSDEDLERLPLGHGPNFRPERRQGQWSGRPASLSALATKPAFGVTTCLGRDVLLVE